MHSKKEIVVILNEVDAKEFIHSRLLNNQVLPITPNARAIIREAGDFEIIDPTKIYKPYSHLKTIASVRKIDKQLNGSEIINHNFSEPNKESLLNIMHVIMCTAFYFKFLLRINFPVIIWKDSRWVRETNKNLCISLLIKRAMEENLAAFAVPTLSVKSQLFVWLYNKLFFLLLAKKDSYWTTGNFYNMPEIISSLNKSNKNKALGIFVLTESNENFFKSILRLVKSFFVNRTLIFIPDTDKNLINKDIDFFEGNFDSFILSIKGVVNKFFNTQLNNYLLIESSLEKTIDRLEPKFLLAHHMRWAMIPEIGYIFLKKNIPTYLISHGTHSVALNKFEEIEKTWLDSGLLYSKYATNTIMQTPSHEQAYLKRTQKLDDNHKIIRTNPLMWGSNVILNKASTRDDVFRILHAGTFKPLGMRPWIYETSNEYLNNLNFLIEVISSIDNCELTIRFRDTEECSLKTLRTLLNLNEKIKISTEGSIHQEITNSDLVISFSSTVIEEALISRKPVALFGGNLPYRHLEGTLSPPTEEKRNAVYHLTQENIKNMLKNLKQFHHNTELTDEELKELIWINNDLGIEKFIKSYLKF